MTVENACIGRDGIASGTGAVSTTIDHCKDYESLNHEGKQIVHWLEEAQNISTLNEMCQKASQPIPKYESEMCQKASQPIPKYESDENGKSSLFKVTIMGHVFQVEGKVTKTEAKKILAKAAVEYFENSGELKGRERNYNSLLNMLTANAGLGLPKFELIQKRPAVFHVTVNGATYAGTNRHNAQAKAEAIRLAFFALCNDAQIFQKISIPIIRSNLKVAHFPQIANLSEYTSTSQSSSQEPKNDEQGPLVSKQRVLEALSKSTPSLGAPFYNYRVLSDNTIKAQLILGERVILSELSHASRADAAEEVAEKMLDLLKNEVVSADDIDKEKVVDNNQPPCATSTESNGLSSRKHECEQDTANIKRAKIDKSTNLNDDLKIVQQLDFEEGYCSDPEGLIKTYKELLIELCKSNAMSPPTFYDIPGPGGGVFCTGICIYPDNQVATFTSLREHRLRRNAVEDVCHDLYVTVKTNLSP